MCPNTVLLLLTIFAAAAAASPNCDVVVIGAGVSGLAAAGSLLAHNLSVCLVEGRDRVGGRVHSVRSASAPTVFFEMGAAWIHGIIDNPIYAIATANNISTVNTDWSKVNVSLSGSWLSPWQVLTGYGLSQLLWSGAQATVQCMLFGSFSFRVDRGR
jgi:hypothetical protein